MHPGIALLQVTLEGLDLAVVTSFLRGHRLGIQLTLPVQCLFKKGKSSNGRKKNFFMVD